jgi:DNA-binding transcriptional LysR family regulator
MVQASPHASRLSVFPAPEPGPAIQVLLLWHRRFDADPAGQWLRDLVTAATT